MASRNHNSTIKLIHSCDICYRWSCSNMHQICISTRSNNSTNKAVFEHVAASTCILTNNYFCFLPIKTVIPSQESTDLVRVICCQSFISFTSEAISSKILTHFFILLFIYLLRLITILFFYPIHPVSFIFSNI